MEPVGLAIGLISTTAALTRVSQLITGLKSAGDEFEAIVHQFTITSTVLTHLKNLFMNSFLPPSLMLGYANQVQKHQSSLESMATHLRLVQQSLNSRSVFKRLSQRRGLVERDLQRFTSQISVLNSNLNLMATTYNCAVINLVYIGVNRVEVGVDRMESSARSVESKTHAVQNARMYISLPYIEIVPKIRLDDAYTDETLERSSTITDPPRYGEIRPVLSTDTGIGTRVWHSDRGPILPPNVPTATVKIQNEKIRGEPVSITGASTSRHPSDPEPPKPLLTTTEETQQTPTPSTGPWVGECLLGSKPQSTFPLKKIQDESLPPLTHTGGYGLWDLSGVQRVQNEGWGMGELGQMQGFEYSVWDLSDVQRVQNEGWETEELGQMQGFEYSVWDLSDVQRVQNEGWETEGLGQMRGFEYSVWDLSCVQRVQDEEWGKGTLEQMRGFEYSL